MANSMSGIQGDISRSQQVRSFATRPRSLPSMRRVVACGVLAAAVLACKTAAAIDCPKARTPVETTICSSLYGALQDSATGTILRDLARRQRAWLKQRDGSCGPKPQVACLASSYQLRIDELTALDNEAEASKDGKLHKLDAVIFEGEWIVDDLPLTAAEKAMKSSGSNGIISSLRATPSGRKVRGTAGQICLVGDGCEDISWTWGRAGGTVGAPRFENDLHFAGSQRVLEGRPTLKYNDEILLVPGATGSVSAIAAICHDPGDECRFVLQPWRPVGKVELPSH